MNTTKIYFKLDKLNAGDLCLNFGTPDENYTYCFDEDLTDAVPNMVKMYNKLNVGESYQWSADYDGYISFAAKVLDNDKVELFINYRSIDKEADFLATLKRNECIKLFDNLFEDILNNKDFPYQFPCFGYLNEEEYEKFGEVADKIYEELVAKKYCDNDLDICDVIDNVICRELVNIEPEGMKYYRKYKKMLLTRTLPKGWAKRPDLDPIGDSFANYIKQHTK